MTLPIQPPYAPMEAKRADRIPAGETWQFEPKWDGFREQISRIAPTQTTRFALRGWHGCVLLEHAEFWDFSGMRARGDDGGGTHGLNGA